VAEQWRPVKLWPRSRREAHRATGGGRWSGSALRGQAGKRTGAAPAGAAGGAAPGRAAAVEQLRLGELRPLSRRATEPHAW